MKDVSVSNVSIHFFRLGLVSALTLRRLGLVSVLDLECLGLARQRLVYKSLPQGILEGRGYQVLPVDYSLAKA